MADKNAADDRNGTKSKVDKPKIGLMSGIALLIGSIIGTGIFISPRGVLLGTGKNCVTLDDDQYLMNGQGKVHTVYRYWYGSFVDWSVFLDAYATPN